MTKSLSVLIVLFLTSPANSMVYSWTDSSGIAHYTNKVYEIPLRYRAKVKARYPEAGDSSTPLQNVQASQAGQNVQTPSQNLQVNPHNPAKSIPTGNIPILQQMKKERIERKAKRHKETEEN